MGTRKITRTESEVVEKEETVKKKEVVEKEQVKFIPVCDFCNQEYPEKDEDYLYNVYLNPSVKADGMRETVKVPMDNNFDQTKELADAVVLQNLVEWERKPVMEETEFESRISLKQDLRDEGISTRSPDFTSSDDLVAFQFRIRHEDNFEAVDDGKIEVCEHCKELMFDNA